MKGTSCSMTQYQPVRTFLTFTIPFFLKNFALSLTSSSYCSSPLILSKLTSSRISPLLSYLILVVTTFMACLGPRLLFLLRTVDRLRELGVRVGLVSNTDSRMRE